MNGRASVAYRENKHVYLPKFEPAKGMLSKPAPAAGPVAATAGEGAPVKLSVTAPSAERSSAPATMSAGKWSARLSPLNPISRLCGVAAAPARPLTAVQIEMRLDAVKVLHNDLSDAEVEVVPLKSRPARSAGAAEPEPAAAWSELGGGLFEANAV
jgi:hypothetical protein